MYLAGITNLTHFEVQFDSLHFIACRTVDRCIVVHKVDYADFKFVPEHREHLPGIKHCVRR